MNKYWTELIGTFFLVLTIGLAVVGEVPLPPLVIGTVLIALVYMGGHISKAHYNPAVSLAFLLRGRMERKDFLPYVVAQILGALLAAWMVYLMTGETFAPAPGPATPMLTILLAEVLFTFLLVLVILNVATARTLEGNSFYGLSIGLTVMAGAFVVGPLSGAAFNPAVGIGPTIIDVIFGEGGFAALWYYLVGPVAGALLAVAAFKVQNPED